MNRPSLALPLTLAFTLLAFSLASAQDEPNGGDPIPLPFTRSGLKVVYKRGLLMRYVKTFHSAGRPPARQHVLNEVIDNDGKSYVVRSLLFDEQGRALGKPSKPQRIPYQVDSKSFRSAKAYEYERVRIGKHEHSAHRYDHPAQFGGRPALRSLWYSGKHRGLLIKTVIRPLGSFGKENYSSMEIQRIPGKLSGLKEPVGAPRGNLPWSDAEIMQAWPKGGYAEYEVKRAAKGKASEPFRFRQTMTGRERTCYVVRETLWDLKGVTKGDASQLQMWKTWLGQVRLAPKSKLEKKLDREVEAAGRKWPCKVYEIGGTTWFLSKEIPGLMVKFASEHKGVKVTRILTSTSLKLPAK